jgi:hypothetical protein
MEKGQSRSRRLRMSLAAISLLVLLSTACATVGPLKMKDGEDKPLEKHLEETLHGRKRIQIVTSEGKAQVLLRPAVLADGLEGRAPGTREPIRYSWPAIRSIQVRKSGTSRGLAIGASVGLLAGLAAAASLGQEEEEPFAFAAGAILLAIPAGGVAAGALLGTMIGAVSSGWRTVYLANDESRPVPRFSLAPARGGGLAVTFALGF